MQVALDPAVSDKAYRVFTVIAAHGKGISQTSASVEWRR